MEPNLVFELSSKDQKFEGKRLDQNYHYKKKSNLQLVLMNFYSHKWHFITKIHIITLWLTYMVSYVDQTIYVLLFVINCNYFGNLY